MITPPPYADQAQLVEWLEHGDYEAPENPARILARASDVISDWVFGQYTVDSTTGLPDDEDLVEVFASATCAQVEQWLEVGEENDIAGFPDGTTMALGAGAVSHLPAVLAPRAARILRRAGLAPVAPDSDTNQLLTVELV